MWTSEKERLGFKKCTPAGYALMSVASLLMPLGMLALLGLGVFVVIQTFSHGWSVRSLTVLAGPLGCLLAGGICYWAGGNLARRRGFVYDYASDSCRWDGMDGLR